MATFLTLGLARFWMKTRMRQMYWSSIEIDGVPFEYTGQAGEKLYGFLVALVAVSVYLI